MFQHHTSQAEIEQRIVERPLVVGKGWVELSLGFDWKHSASEFLTGDSKATVGFVPDKHFERYDNDGRLDFRTWSLDARWGFTKGTDVYLHIPIVWNSLQNSNVGEDGSVVNVNTVALGDLEFGILAQLLRKVDPGGKFNSSLGMHFDVKAPTGLESPGSNIPSPGLITVLPAGTGTYNLGLDLEFKQQIAIMAVNVRAGYVWRASNVVMYLAEDDWNLFQMRLAPGDGIQWDVGLTFQLANFLALGLGGEFEYRFLTKIGPSSSGIAACKNCDPVADSDGLYMDGYGMVSVTPSRAFQVDVRFAYTLGGRRAFLIPIEDVSPTRGWTAGGAVTYRF